MRPQFEWRTCFSAFWDYKVVVNYIVMTKNYEAPVVELINVRIEHNIMSEVTAGVSGDMNVWDEQEI